MSDLQCAARFFLVASGSPGPAIERLSAERVAAVLGTGDATMEVISAALTGGVAQVRDDLGAEESLAHVLEEVVDSFRGESVAVVAPAAVVLGAVERLTPGAPRTLAPGDVVQVDGDADGWVVRQQAPLSRAAPG